jgi:hypothetical protein
MTKAKEKAPAKSARKASPFKRAPRPLGDDYARIVVRAVARVLAVDVTVSAIAALSPGDQQTLYQLTSRIFYERVPGWHADALKSQREQATAEAEEFAGRVESTPPPGGVVAAGRDLLGGNQALLAQYAREQGRKPSREEASAILDNRNPTATLDDVSVPKRQAPTSTPSAFETFASTADLKTAELLELERLIEAAAGKPGLFAGRRKDAEMKKQMKGALDRLLAVPPRKRRHYEEAGAVVLPAGVFKDVESASLWPVDVAYLAFILASFEGRRPLGGARFEDDGTTLVVDPRRPLFGQAPDGRGHLTNLTQDAALRDLHRAGWLEVDPVPSGFGGGAREVRIRKGRHMKEADAKRADVS